jgi:hypothetical protein
VIAPATTIEAIFDFINTHGVFDMGVMWVISVMVTSMAAPTKDNGPFYVWFFKCSNTLVGGMTRALDSRVESSPNFPDAVKKLNGTNGGK